MTRVVSRLYTDYLPRHDSANKHFPLFGETPSAKEESSAVPPAPSLPPRTTAQRSESKRIFVARVPPSVTEEELRQHFEKFGVVEDAYRPRDFAKNTFRGIGFVTFLDAAAVDRVIATKHTLGGGEVVVDRATPKDTPPVREDVRMGAKSEIGEKSHRSSASVETLVNNYGTALFGPGGNAFDVTFVNSVRSSSCVAYPSSNGNNRGPPSNFSDDLAAEGTGEFYSLASPARLQRQESDATLKRLASPRVQSPMKSEKHQRMTDNLAHVRKVRGGPRIFVGKISKETVEQDLADYFSQFGFVMDVYIPRSKENKKEHRGFGFVTFETEASIKRAISQGLHHLKGATLAIDVAVPEGNQSGE